MSEKKLALVTGSSRGLGRAIAVVLAQRGINVWVHYLNNEVGAQETALLVRECGVEAFITKAHLRYPEEIQALFDEIEQKAGGVDILVNNAASGKFSTVLSLNQKGWEWCMDINARAVLQATQQAVRFMEKKGWGRVVNVTGMGSQRCIPDYAAIGASKAALEALTRYLAVELAPKGILVNAVASGTLDTDALKSFPDCEERLRNVRERIPTGRLGTPEDVAKVVAFLCSDDAGWICGQTIICDGGYGLIG